MSNLIADYQATYRIDGGPGSGNFGHSGRPGQVGGAGDGGSAGSQTIQDYDVVKIRKGYEDSPSELNDEYIAYNVDPDRGVATIKLIDKENKYPFGREQNVGIESIYKVEKETAQLEKDPVSPTLYEKFDISGRDKNFEDVLKDKNLKDFVFMYSGKRCHAPAVKELPNGKWAYIGTYMDKRTPVEIYQEKTSNRLEQWGFVSKRVKKKRNTDGGAGSGNFGHSGRPGQVGGSGDGEGKQQSIKIGRKTISIGDTIKVTGNERMPNMKFTGKVVKIDRDSWGDTYIGYELPDDYNTYRLLPKTIKSISVVKPKQPKSESKSETGSTAADSEKKLHGFLDSREFSDEYRNAEADATAFENDNYHYFGNDKRKMMKAADDFESVVGKARDEVKKFFDDVPAGTIIKISDAYSAYRSGWDVYAAKFPDGRFAMNKDLEYLKSAIDDYNKHGVSLEGWMKDSNHCANETMKTSFEYNRGLDRPNFAKDRRPKVVDTVKIGGKKKKRKTSYEFEEEF